MSLCLKQFREAASLVMRGFISGMIKGLVILALVCVAVLGGVLAFLHSPFFRFPSGGEYPPPRINELIWPTVGCPAMVMPGETLVVEVDLWVGEDSPQQVSGWKATLSPARAAIAGLVFELEPVGARQGASQRWPYRSVKGRSEVVWHTSFKVPDQAVPELYDLNVEVDVEGEHISDAQPHAVAVTADDDDDFTFITLSDIHVHERDSSSLLSVQTDKGFSQDGDPLFFAEAIRQVNLIRPDFVLVLGDFVRGQRRPGDLLTESERFYDALLGLEVPAFLLPGNHDKYINEIDGMRWYENNIGPLYYSFDIGGSHFSCLDSYQWPEDDRLVMNKLLFMEPRKWQGQVLDAEDEGDPATYAGELAWLEAELAAHRDAPLKVMAMHHDPFTPDDQGFSFIDVNYWGIYRAGGGGEGREALLGTASRHAVDAVFGGHLHSDEVGEVAWESGGGETLYSCQTCVYFDQGGESEHYPGYRLVRVEDGYITSFAYLNGTSSYPFYDGSVPGGVTDIDGLELPSLDLRVLQTMREGGPNILLEVESYLATAMELSGIVMRAPAPPAGGYAVEGGELYSTVEMPGEPGEVLLYVRTRVGAGTPGTSGEAPGEPAVRTITVSAR